jgi:hypothetical protein
MQNKLFFALILFFFSRFCSAQLDTLSLFDEVLELPFFKKPEEDLEERNKLILHINSSKTILNEGKTIAANELKNLAKLFIMNPLKNDDLAYSPTKAAIILIPTGNTSYGFYISVYNEAKKAYTELWEEQANLKYSKPFIELSENERLEVH